MFQQSEVMVSTRNQKCSNCRFFEVAPLRHKGWCRNPRLYPSHLNHLVEDSALDCNRRFRSRLYWEPIISVETESFDAVHDYVLPQVERESNPIIGSIGEATEEIKAFQRSDPVWTDPGVYGYQKRGAVTPVRYQYQTPESTIVNNRSSNTGLKTISVQRGSFDFGRWHGYRNLFLVCLPALLFVAFYIFVLNGGNDKQGAISVSLAGPQPTETAQSFISPTPFDAKPSRLAVLTIEAYAYSLTPTASSEAKAVPTSTPAPAPTQVVPTSLPPTSTPTVNSVVGIAGKIGKINTACYLRKSAILASPVLHTFKIGDHVTLLEGPLTNDNQDWYRVKFGDQTGWVLKKFINV